MRWSGRSTVLGRLVSEARVARRRRLRELLHAGTSPPSDVSGRRRRAGLLLDRMLACRLPDRLDCCRYLELLASRHQMASEVIATMMTSVEPVELPSTAARALATALTDLLHFVEAGVPEAGSVGVYLAVAREDDCLVVGLGVDGDVQPLAGAEASCSLQRGSEVVRLMGGEFQRGVDGDGRMVFGLMFPAAIMEADL